MPIDLIRDFLDRKSKTMQKSHQKVKSQLTLLEIFWKGKARQCKKSLRSESEMPIDLIRDFLDRKSKTMQKSHQKVKSQLSLSENF